MRIKMALLCLIGTIVIGGLMAVTSPYLIQAQQATATTAPTPTALPDSVYAPIDAMDEVIENLYQRISPSVVHVTTQSQVQTFFNGPTPE